MDAKGDHLSGKDVLDAFFKLHCDTVRTPRGHILRWKIMSASLSGGVCGILVKFFERLLKIACGRTLEPDDLSAGLFKPYKKEDMKLVKTERIEVHGYKVAKTVMVNFCILVLLAYTIAYVTRWLPRRYLTELTSNALLVLCVAVFGLWFLDHGLSALILRITNGLIRLRLFLVTKNFKF